MSVSQLAQKIIDAYAHDPEGLTREECASLGLSDDQAGAITTVLGKGAEGAVTEEERAALASAGFDKTTIDEIAGVFGSEALRERAKWLGDRAKVVSGDYDREKRAEFVRELGEMGYAASSVLSMILYHELNDEQIAEFVRELGEMGPAAISVLGMILHHGLDDEQKMAAEAFVKIGPASIPVLIETLGSYYVREFAAQALVDIGSASVPALLDVLKSGEREVQHEAAQVLGSIRPVTPDVLPALFEMLKDKNYYVRGAAAETLGLIGPVTPDVIPALFEALKDKDNFVRAMAVLALGDIGPVTPDVVPALMEALKDGDGIVRASAARALVQIGREDDPVLIAAHEKTKEEMQAQLKTGVKNSFKRRTLSTLLRAMQELPYEFFVGVNFEFKPYGSGGKYTYGDVLLRRDCIDLSCVAHEFAHHWDDSLAPEKDSLFNRISWQGEEYRYSFSSDECNVGYVLEREGFDRADFAREYGLCNLDEDLATVVESYVGMGKSFRRKIRKQMARGNFELAAKYLFVKHVMPFKGKEYGVDDKSPALTIEEVKEKYLAAKDTFKTDPGTWDVILEIEKSIPNL